MVEAFEITPKGLAKIAAFTGETREQISKYVAADGVVFDSREDSGEADGYDVIDSRAADDFDVTVSLENVTTTATYRTVARFESMLNASHYAKWLSAENPGRVVQTSAFIDDREPNYVRRFLNGKRA